MKYKLIAVSAALLVSSAAFAQAINTVAKIKASGVVTVGVRESSGALSYALGDGRYAGYHVEICERIIANLEKAAGRKLEVKYHSVTPQNRVALVQNGTVDLECGSTSNSLARSKDVSFLVTAFVEEVRMAVKASSGIRSIAHLAGKNIATTTGTTSVQTLRKHEMVQHAQFNEVYGKDHAESFALLESGRADAFVMDGSILAANIAASNNPASFRIEGEVLSLEPIAIMIRKNDNALKKIGDDTITGLIRAGEIARIYEKWFMQPIPPKNTRIGLPASGSTRGAWSMPNDNPMEDYRR